MLTNDVVSFEQPGPDFIFSIKESFTNDFMKLLMLQTTGTRGKGKGLPVSHSLMAVEAVGVRVPLYLGHS